MGSASLGPTLRKIGRLFDEGTVAGFSDTQLLERFTTSRDAQAFEALVERHGPMVLGVCRGVLKDVNDAQDAFQATFLVLVRKADSLWVIKSSLGSWLYRVAYRIAIQANADAVRRRQMERRANSPREGSGPDQARGLEVLPVLHEEIDRLPERFRAPIVLCHLEEMTHAEAADQLGWSVGTVRGRVARARKLLQARLTRRGVVLSAGLATALLSEAVASAAIPREWVVSTVGIATKLAAGQAISGAVSATALAFSGHLLKRMTMTKLKWATATLLVIGAATGAAATFVPPRGDDDTTRQISPLTGAANPAGKAVVKNELSEKDKPVRIAGRVVDPDGRPKEEATIYLRHHHYRDPNEVPRLEHAATTGPDGRFQFDLDPAKSDAPAGDRPSWQEALITAVAPGFAGTWIDAGSTLRGELELRLVRDDRPIHGRILDDQGRPVANATIRVARIAVLQPKLNLDALLSSGKLDWDGMNVVALQRPDYDSPLWIGKGGTVTTDTTGRFQIQGIGNDRAALLYVEAEGLERSAFAVLGRVPQKGSQPKPRARSSQPDMINQEIELTLYGTTFDHVVGPGKPISGVVRVKGTGLPVAGVTVAGQIMGRPWTTIMVSTDKDGRYHMGGLPKAPSYNLDVRTKAGGPYLIRPRTVVGDTEGLKPIAVSFELTRGVAIRGRVLDKDSGRPVACDWVQYHPLPGNSLQSTIYGNYSPSDQTMRLTVPPGEGIVVVKVAGTSHRYPGARLAAVDKGKLVVQGEDGAEFGFPLSMYHAYRFVKFPAETESATIDLEVTASVPRKGKLVDPEDQPVENALALGLVSDRFASSTLKGSTFEVNGLRSDESRLIEVRQESLGLAGSVTVEGSSPAGLPLVVKLEHCGALTGRLVDEDGSPLKGAEVSAWVRERRAFVPSDPAFRSRRGMTDAKGNFRIEGINPTLEVVLQFQDPNHPTPKFMSKPEKDLGHLRVKPGQVLDLGDIRIRSQRLP